MKVLFYRYESIVEPHLIDIFVKSGIDIEQLNLYDAKKNISEIEIIEKVSSILIRDNYLFVFSINFFPELSDVCQIHNIPYVCWTVDSPFMQLFSRQLHNSCNRIFFFDRAQYETFGKQLDDKHGFYLPLAGNYERFSKTINESSENIKRKFRSDVSFVGSLYNEKNPYTNIKNIPDYLNGYVRGIEEAQMNIFGANILESLLSKDIIDEFEKIVPDIQNNDSFEKKRYLVAHFIIGMDIAYHERVNILNKIANLYNLDLYTLSDISDLKNVNFRGRANSFTEMPIIFNQSNINLNITMRPIQTGLSQRIFDVVASGGFLITNYQEELPEMFEIGTEVESYSSQEELIDKIGFYLKHEDIRKKIAENGLNRLKNEHTFEHRFRKMISEVLNSL